MVREIENRTGEKGKNRKAFQLSAHGGKKNVRKRERERERERELNL